MSERTYNTRYRESWNQPIHNILKAIDNHNKEYFQTKDIWHLQKAEMLREYVNELKTWIHCNESSHEKIHKHPHEK